MSIYSQCYDVPKERKINCKNSLSPQILVRKAILVFNLMFQYLEAEKLNMIITEKEKKKEKLDKVNINWEKQIKGN